MKCRKNHTKIFAAIFASRGKTNILYAAVKTNRIKEKIHKIKNFLHMYLLLALPEELLNFVNKSKDTSIEDADNSKKGGTVSNDSNPKKHKTSIKLTLPKQYVTDAAVKESKTPLISEKTGVKNKPNTVKDKINGTA